LSGLPVGKDDPPVRRRAKEEEGRESMRTIVKFTIPTTEESTWRAGEYIGEHGLASVLPNPPQVIEGEVVAHKAK